ncbi:hypothetical protein [Chryseobacterium sp.]|uniref:hypothetical protein n=1 Tax=Chryseobacterium sp. TaxID=1871047 RepID=UPI002898F8EF|nr:hypothetical protein [Chryseobacterium sp.]
MGNIKTEKNINEVFNFELTEKTKIIYGNSGRGKSWIPFFQKHNLFGLSDEDLNKRLNEIIQDKSLEEAEINMATAILLSF